MTFTLLTRRSAVAGHAPTTSQLQDGEIAVNTHDGLIYFVQNSGTATVVALGAVPATANALTNSVTISLSGDASGSVAFNGSANVAISTTLAAVGTPGTYTSLTTDSKGRVIAGANMTATGDVTGTAVGTNIVLTLALSGVAAGTYNTLVVNSKGIITAGSNSTVTLTGDMTGNGLVSNVVTVLANSGVVAGTYSSLVVDAKGRVITGLNESYSGDVSGASSGANSVLTLNTVNSNVGAFSVLTVNSKGLVTAARSLITSDITTGLGYTPVNKAGDTMTGALTINTGSSNGAPFSIINNFNGVLPTVVGGGSIGMNLSSMNGEMDFINTFYPVTTQTAGFSWYQQTSANSSTELMNLTNTGVLSVTKSISTVTQPTTDNSSNVATTAYTKNLIGAFTGDATTSVSGGSVTLTLATVNPFPGSYTCAVFNTKGLVTSTGNLVATGDVVGTASGFNITLTMPNIATVGTYTSVSINSKGLVIAGSNPAHNFATNGYQVLPSGLILQWGAATLTGTGNVSLSVTFPLTFPTACLNIVVSDNNGTNGTNIDWGAVIVSVSSMTLWKTTTLSANTPSKCFWHAIGY